MNCALCWDYNIIIFFIYSAKLWCQRVGRFCTMEEAGFLHYKFLCRDHFLPTDLFLKYDVQFESERLDTQLPVIAKWEHIEKIYKQEKHFMIHRLCKLTDDHLAPVTECTMKVSLVVQVVNHTLAAAVYSVVSYDNEQCLHSFFS